MFCRITGGDRRLFGEASYQLGSAFINNGDPQTALAVATFKVFCTIKRTGTLMSQNFVVALLCY